MAWATRMLRKLLLGVLTVGALGCTNALAPTAECADGLRDRPGLCVPDRRAD